MTALVLRDDQTYWDENQLAVLRSRGIDGDVTKPELQAYLHECQTRRLDPFTGQIHLIGRWDKRAKRKVYRSQTGIDGFRVIARRAADEAQETIEYEDTLWCGPDGQWTDVWLSGDAPAACKVVVLRDGKRFPATARFTSYVQVNNDGEAVGLWLKMADNQLAKCTEALALRKAFPEDLGGLYTEEEMAQADNPQRVTATVEVIRDERQQGLAGEEDQEWAAQVASMSAFATEADGQELWKAVVARRKDGKINRAEDARLKELIKARWAVLNAPAKEGTVVAPLEPGDPWLAGIEEIASHSELEQLESEVVTQVDAGTLDAAKAASIRAAITTRAQAIREGRTAA